MRFTFPCPRLPVFSGLCEASLPFNKAFWRCFSCCSAMLCYPTVVGQAAHGTAKAGKLIIPQVKKWLPLSSSTAFKASSRFVTSLYAYSWQGNAGVPWPWMSDKSSVDKWMLFAKPIMSDAPQNFVLCCNLPSMLHACPSWFHHLSLLDFFWFDFGIPCVGRARPFSLGLLVFSYTAVLWPEYLSLFRSGPEGFSLTLSASFLDHFLISPNVNRLNWF